MAVLVCGIQNGGTWLACPWCYGDTHYCHSQKESARKNQLSSYRFTQANQGMVG